MCTWYLIIVRVHFVHVNCMLYKLIVHVHVVVPSHYTACSCFRCGFFPFDTLSCQLTEAQDYAIVHFVDSMCRSLATTADSIEPWDISLSEAHVTSHQLSPLQGTLLLFQFSSL